MTRMLGALTLTIVMFATGCTTATDRPAEEGLSEVGPRWHRRLDVIGQPVMAAGVAVVLVTARTDELDIVGVDVATGRIRWRAPYSPGDIASGYGLTPAVVEDGRGRELVAYQRPAKGLTISSDFDVPVVAVDPRTGREVYRSEARTLTTPLGPCTDGTDVCAQPLVGVELRFDLDDPGGRGPALARPEQSGRPEGSRDVAAGGLYATGDRPGEAIGRTRNGRVLWQKAVSRLFGAGHTTDYGWSIDYDERADRFTGSVGKPFPQKEYDAYAAGRTVPTDLARFQLVSFRGRDGRVVWRQSGVQACVPGDVEDDQPLPRVRCRITGTKLEHEDRAPRYRRLRAVLEGYDARGRTTWRHQLTDRWAKRFLAGDGRPLAGRDAMIVETTDGPRRVDLAAGSATEVTADDRFFCEADRTELRYAVAWDTTNDRYGGRLRYLCDSRGRRLRDARPTVDAVRGGAVEAGDRWWLVADRKGLTGYRLDAAG